MAAEGAADHPPGDDTTDARYYVPFGRPPADDVTAYAPPEQTFPPPVGDWPPPGGPGPARSGSRAVGGRRVRGPRTGAVVAVAALTALLVGASAGYGGARLAGMTAAPVAPAPGATSSGPVEPSAAPSTASSPAGEPNGAAFDPVAVAAKALPGTVTIAAGRSTGSGFVLDAEGRILTNNHVVAGAAGATIRVGFSDGRRQNATLVGRSPSYDLAVLKVKPAGYLRPLAVGDSDAIRIGEPVLALGAPLGLSDSVTQGIVSAVNRPVVVQSDGSADAPFAFIDGVQTDAAINPGSSGGPLVDGQARVIGINSAILTRGGSEAQSGNIGVGFAIPVNQAKTIADLLINDGKASYPVIGANLREVGNGLELTEVDGAGPARKAGLRAGDVVTKIDDRRVSRTEELIVEIRTRRPGEKVVLEYERGNARARATVTLGGREG